MRVANRDGGEGGEQAMHVGRCPICRKPASGGYRPFCSKRCADVDLARWLGGTYAIPVVEEDGAENREDGTPDPDRDA